MRNFLILCLCTLASLAVPSHSQPTVQADVALREVQTLENITELALPNGLQVLLLPDAAKPVVTVNITYRVGSRHEGRGETGAAHLLEHMLFKPSGKVENPMRDMQALGMRYNGTTSPDRTNYFAHFLANDDKATERMDYMLGWLAGMMTQARFTRAELDSEMTVVRNEFERAENEPGRVLGDRMRALAYGAHGYGHSTLGLKSDIENVTLPTLYAFYRKHYRPDNATLIVAGAFDAAQVRQKIAQAFAPIARPPEPLAPPYTLNPGQDGERSVLLRRSGGLGTTAVLYHLPAGGTREGAAARVLAEAISQRAGPLSRGLLATGLAVTDWAYYRSLREPGYLMAGVGLPEIASIASAATPVNSGHAGNADERELGAIKSAAALARVVESLSLTDAEIITARQTLLANWRTLLRDAEATAQALTEMVALGDWRLIFALREALATVSPDDVRALAKNYLVASNRTAGTYLPLAGAAPLRAPPPVPVAQARLLNTTELIASYADRTRATGLDLGFRQKTSQNAVKPAFEDFALTPASLQARAVRSQLAVGGLPGLKLAVLPRAAKDDRITGLLRLRWGTLESVNGTSVLATMLGPLLLEGTGGLNGLNGVQVKERLLALDARLSFTSFAGFLNASLDFPASSQAAYFELLAQLLQGASFADAPFERNQKAMLATMQNIKAGTVSVAGNALDRSFKAYPLGDPRETRTLEQTEAQMKAASAAQLRAYWQRFGSASHGELTLVGPADAAALRAQLQASLAGWAAREKHEPWASVHTEPAGPKMQILPMADKANASYSARIGLPFNERDADYPALFAAVQLLARQGLWERVREKEGLSYGVGASLTAPWDGNAGAININASFAPQNRSKLANTIREVLVARRDEGFGALEVGFAKSAIVARRGEWLAQPANTAANLAFNLRYDRAFDSYGVQTSLYEKLDTPAVNAALKKYLNPDQLVEVMAGTFE